MLKNSMKQLKTINSFLIPTALLLIILTVLSCGGYDNVVAPKDQDSEVLAAPSSGPKMYSGSAWIGNAGGTVNVTGGAKIIVPPAALNNDTYITATIEVYESEAKIHYIFGPHGTFFNVTVRVEMPWSYLKNYNGPLQLWYLEDNGVLTIAKDACPDEIGKRYVVYVNHFSEYYFPRR
ncbi:hypothetical protein FJZ31_42605 [Candidatus Poribacteria bacterium]|nr:hypothetical protein [Candidatus Poribacteria bacterium]